MKCQAIEVNLALVTSAFNEEKNVGLLYKKIVDSAEKFQSNSEIILNWKLIFVDNDSHDKTAVEISRLTRMDSRVVGVHNLRNYGPEASFLHGLEYIENADIVILLCSDLQDPPSFAFEMLAVLLADENPRCDAVLARKEKSVGSKFIRLGRKLYYLLLDFANRDLPIVAGYHGFGCYSRHVIDDAIWLWNNTAMNMRGCLTYASSAPRIMNYMQPERQHGKSSYSLTGYTREAATAITSGNSFASRLSLRVGIVGLTSSLLILIFILINRISGTGNYASGIATLSFLLVSTFAVQVIMISFVSRQIEQQNGLKIRRQVKSNLLR